MTDQMIIGAVLNVLNSAIANPSLLESGGEISIYSPNADMVRQQNEINRMIDAEEQGLSERLAMLKSQNKTSAETQAKLDKIMDMIDHEKFELEIFDNVLIRKLIECIKVLSKTEILVIFKGGYEVRAEIE